MANDADPKTQLSKLDQLIGEGSEIDPIRTETIFSRMPLHVLSKSGPRPQINIKKRSAEGKISEKWEVTYNEKYGPARQLAYDLHTLVIERAIEEAFEEARRTNQPFPRLIPLSSLNDVANRLGPNAETRNTNRIKKALSQNAGILISALKRYRGNDGVEYTLEGVFTPYGIFFFGQKLPSGTRADQVYINLNDAYFEAWSRSASRPLDYNYKAQLPPIPRRFYELVSYAMYGAIKNGQPTARYRYSEFCKNAPQLRYEVFDQVKKQMYKIHRPHVEAGYILKVKYEETIDEAGKPDWWMIYRPGPRAYTEFAVFTGKKPRLERAAEEPAKLQPSKAGESGHRRTRQRHLNLALAPDADPAPQPVVIDYRVIAELAKRGVGESDARQLLASLTPGQPVLDQLEWGDYQIAQARTPIANPPGFYISLLQRNVPVPSTFESSQAKKTRLEAESAQRKTLQEESDARFAAEEAETAALNSQIAGLPEPARLALLSQAKAELLAKVPLMAHYFKNHPEANSQEGVVWSKARKLLKEGWTFQPTDTTWPQQPVAVQPQAEAEPAGDVPLDLTAILSRPLLPAPSPAPAATLPELVTIDPQNPEKVS